MSGKTMTMRSAPRCAAALLLLAAGPAGREARAVGRRQPVPETVRILLRSGTTGFELDAPGDFNVVDTASRRVLMGVRPGKVRVEARAGQFWFGRYPLPWRELRIVPSPGSQWLGADGTRYRGTLRVIPDPAGNDRLSLVNDIEMEEYLVGVIGREMPAGWPMAALAAQAIAARSHALHAVRTQREQPYDLVANRSQAYGGFDAESPAAREAVQQTAGLILYHRGKPLPAYFSATCGGHTENGHEVFPGDGPMPPAVRCDWCRQGSHYQWALERSADEVTRQLQAAGLVRGAVRDIQVAALTVTGRVRTVTIETSAGAESVSGTQLRRALGPDALRSLWFQVGRTGSGFRFAGRGWGHGVGLCQNGAGAMAKAGAGAGYILRHYYPGTEVKAAQ